MKTKLLVLVLLVAMLATLLFSMTSCGLFGGDDETSTSTTQTPPRGPGEVTTGSTPAERVPSGWGPEEGIN